MAQALSKQSFVEYKSTNRKMNPHNSLDSHKLHSTVLAVPTVATIIRGLSTDTPTNFLGCAYRDCRAMRPGI
jgi:hypothetical protein